MPALETPPRPPTTQGYGADPLHRYGLLTPKFWHGMGLGDWLPFWAAHWNKLSAHGYVTASTIAGVAAFNSFWGAVQSLFYGPRINALRLEQPPLFVLGHWRSGTTLLHELLMLDQRHISPNTYECFAPQHFLVTETVTKPLTRWLLPAKRPMDNVETGWDKPQEDEFALCSLGLPSPYRCWAFPNEGPVHSEYLTLEEVPTAERAHWQRTLERFVKAVTLRNKGRMILKSPPHTARVKVLLEIFPEARFVHICRDPLTLYPSTVRLWKSLCDTQGLEGYRAEYDWIEPEVLSNFETMYAAFERDRALVPAGRLVDVKYEDLVAQPRAEMQRVYDSLGLDRFAAVAPSIDGYFSEKRDYKTNRYQLPAEIEAKVRERWAGYFERYGY